MFTQINSTHCPFKVMLMSVAGLFAWAAIGFPLNPSFTPEVVKEYKAMADAGERHIRLAELAESEFDTKICYDIVCQKQVMAGNVKGK